MAYYVRKIARSKWNVLEEGAPEIICNYRADAIANDLRTTNDTLSFWKVDSLNDDDLEPVIVINALLGDTISYIDLLCVPDEMLCDFQLEAKDGDTIVSNYMKLHYNVASLSIKSLLKFVRNVVLKILLKEKSGGSNTEPSLIRRYTDKQQVKLIKEWIDKKEIEYGKLKPRQKESYEKILSKIS